MKKELNACVDWLQVTFKNVNDLHEIINILRLGYDNFTEIEHGRYGYDSQLRFGHIAVYYNQYRTCEMGVHVEFSGQGCREYEDYVSDGFNYLLPALFQHEINVTRFDIAIDDRSGYFTVAQLERKVRDGFTKSKFKTARGITEYKISGGCTLGKTFYFGSTKSDLQVRFYDKKEEMISKKRFIPEELQSWVRTELQLRRENAYQAALKFIETNGRLQDIALGILKNYITFCNKTNDTNKNRWTVSKFWAKFLHDVELITITKESPEVSIEKSKDWFENSITPTFAVLMKAFNSDTDMLNDWYRKGLAKMSPKHENMLKRFQYENGIFEENNKIKVVTSEEELYNSKKNIIQEKQSISSAEIEDQEESSYEERYNLAVKNAKKNRELSTLQSFF